MTRPDTHGAGREPDVNAAMFTRIAPTYDRLNHVLSGGMDILWRRRAVRRLGNLTGGPIVDIGAGTGDLTLEVARRGMAPLVIAADHAAGMLAVSRRKTRDENLPAKVVHCCADALCLPFDENAFAGAIMGFGLRNLVDPEKGIAEARRVLRPGSPLVLLEFTAPPGGLFGRTYGMYLKSVLPRLGAALSGDKPAYLFLSHSIQGFLKAEEIRDLMAGAGFSDVTSRRLLFGIAHLFRGIA